MLAICNFFIAVFMFVGIFTTLYEVYVTFRGKRSYFTNLEETATFAIEFISLLITVGIMFLQAYLN